LNQTEISTTPGLSEGILPSPTQATEIHTSTISSDTEIQNEEVATVATTSEEVLASEESESSSIEEILVETTTTKETLGEKDILVQEVPTTEMVNQFVEKEEMLTTIQTETLKDVRNEEEEVQTEMSQDLESTEATLEVTTTGMVDVPIVKEANLSQEQVESTTQTEMEISTEQPYLSLEKLFIDQFGSNQDEILETQKKRRKVPFGTLNSDVDQNLPSEITLENSLDVADDLENDDPALLDQHIDDESSVNSDWGMKISTSKATIAAEDVGETTQANNVSIDDIIIAGIEKSLQTTIPADDSLRYKMGNDEANFDLVGNA